MTIDKNNAMLLDVQYVPENRKANLPDFCYIIWKEIDSGKKHLEKIPNPPVNIYFEKPEYRNHRYFKTEESLDHLEKVTIPYKNIINAIAKEDPEAREFMNQCFLNQNYRDLERVKLCKYAFGHDYDIRTIYRNMWMDHYDNDKAKHIHKAYGDIEVDIMEASGEADPTKCPIDLVTVIDRDQKHSFTFILTGVTCPEKDTSMMSIQELKEDETRHQMYEHRLKEQAYWQDHYEELIEECHKMFDENYPGFEYSAYWYTDEVEMITDLFKLIHQLSPDFLQFWNISFDIPYIIHRLQHFGINPADIICHPDFPNRECRFKYDNFHFQIKNKTHFFRVSDYTIYVDQMVNYAAIRKGQSELRNNKLTYIAKREVGDEKLNYSEEGTIKTFSYRNWLKYFLYNIKDVLLQHGIEEATNDLETFYIYSYENITQYENVFKQTVKLRNFQYRDWLQQGLVPGVNVNAFKNGDGEIQEEDEEDDEDEEVFEIAPSKKKKDVGYEGALVGNPLLINHFGDLLYGKRTNNIFRFSIDMDMTAFYPSTVGAMNIYPACLIFKVILLVDQYDVRGGEIPFNGITDVQMVKENDNSFVGDVAKEALDNFITGNLLAFAHKWMNFPTVDEVYQKLKEK